VPHPCGVQGCGFRPSGGSLVLCEARMMRTQEKGTSPNVRRLCICVSYNASRQNSLVNRIQWRPSSRECRLCFRPFLRSCRLPTCDRAVSSRSAFASIMSTNLHLPVPKHRYCFGSVPATIRCAAAPNIYDGIRISS